MHAAGNEPGEVAMSASSTAPTESQSPEGGEVDGARVSRAAADDELGPMLVRETLDLVHVDEAVAVDAVATGLNHLPVRFGAAPWLRWPPASRRHAEHRVAPA